MTAKDPERKKLSKAILQMKFMKKSKDRFDKERDLEEGRAMFASEVTEDMRTSGSKIIIEPSYVPCENLITGRLSYHGMNPEIERLLFAEKKQSNELKRERVEDSDQVDVSDVEMARRYTSLVGTLSNRFKSKNNRKAKSERSEPPAKKAKFLKPNDD
ncbi:M-phase phosphoprotein, putative [Pediculus humanus corporis]|uniref:M-phase phosphoprotein, putative n=1 Tax=Pediculus humanus subsp. corporis TaxID=121224 RepID=E0VIC4_PEDHC|nr:M-phase phosphoprotein, putative [Pediculus humanus corporis]EEB13130.1 M-phase phosphoprotein, putative [Pediculus humanus corporis]